MSRGDKVIVDKLSAPRRREEVDVGAVDARLRIEPKGGGDAVVLESISLGGGSRGRGLELHEVAETLHPVEVDPRRVEQPELAQLAHASTHAVLSFQPCRQGSRG